MCHFKPNLIVVWVDEGEGVGVGVFRLFKIVLVVKNKSCLKCIKEIFCWIGLVKIVN